MTDVTASHGRAVLALRTQALRTRLSDAPSIQLALVCSVALVLRVIPWMAGYPLHPDEALYGTWAKLIASGRDPLLLNAWVDKPPLALYALAGSLKLFGASEASLRLPGMIAGMLLVTLTYGFARRLHGSRTALAAAGLVALSPFAVLFSPTAFVDPLLAVWLVAAAWAAACGRPWGAGVALGLAIASKQQGVLGIPLVAGLLAVAPLPPKSGGEAPPPPQSWGGAKGSPRSRGAGGGLPFARRLLVAAPGVVLILTPATWWDSLRWATRPSFWDRSLTTYGGLTLAPLAQWPQRAREWGTVLGYLFGLPLLSAGVLALALAAAVHAARRIRGSLPKDHSASFDSAPLRSGCSALFPAVADLVLVLYAAGYLALHFGLTFQPWDRYLLPLAPLLSIPAAHGLILVWDRRPAGGSASALVGVGMAALLAYAAWLGAAGRLPVGSDHAVYAGLDQAAAALAAQPADTVIYQRGLGWHLDYYLFDAPQERRWWSDDGKLARDVAATAAGEPARPQLLLTSAWEASATEGARAALAGEGLGLSEAAHFDGRDGRRAFTLYRVTQLAEDADRGATYHNPLDCGRKPAACGTGALDCGMDTGEVRLDR